MKKKTFNRDIGSIDISDAGLQSLKNMTLNKYLIYTVFMLFLHCIFEDLMGNYCNINVYFNVRWDYSRLILEKYAINSFVFFFVFFFGWQH